jgi:hypothetical protein
MKRTTLALAVEDVTDDQKDVLTSDLQDFLAQRVREASTKRVKRNPETLDAGATLIAVLAAPFVVELAKALRDWIAKRQVKVSISSKGATSVTGSPNSVERIVRRLTSSKGEASAKPATKAKRKQKSS